MFDFRTTSLDRMALVGPKRSRNGQTETFSLRDPVRIQTPRAPCFVTRDNKLVLTRLPGEFQDFLLRVETALCAALDKEPAGQKRTAMYLPIFVDVDWFDAAGQFINPDLELKGCCCLLELQGAYVTETSHGPRWKLVQVRMCEPPPEPFLFVDDDWGNEGNGGLRVVRKFGSVFLISDSDEDA